MNDKEAIAVLMRLSVHHALSDEEKEAVSAAIGILSWSTLAESRMKQHKQRQDDTSD